MVVLGGDLGDVYESVCVFMLKLLVLFFGLFKNVFRSLFFGGWWYIGYSLAGFIYIYTHTHTYTDAYVLDIICVYRVYLLMDFTDYIVCFLQYPIKEFFASLTSFLVGLRPKHADSLVIAVL